MGELVNRRMVAALDNYAVCVQNRDMKQMLTDRTAAAIVALTDRPGGLRLAEIARLTSAPLSSAQRTMEALLDEGLAVRVGERRPRYRLAPDAPRHALTELASWRLTPARAARISQQAAAMEGADDLPALDLDKRRSAIADPQRARQLAEVAERLIWWQNARQTLRHPERLIAQAMAIGTAEDAQLVQELFGEEVMRNVLTHAPAGVFNERRWDYWHLRFGYRKTPPMPVRVL